MSTYCSPVLDGEPPLGEFGTDAHLVRAVQAGDDGAMEELLARATRTARRWSVRWCDDTTDVEDIVQEAVLKTYRYAAALRDPDSFRTWLYRTVKNAFLMSRRRRSGEPKYLISLDSLAGFGEHPSLEVCDERPGPERQAINTALRLRVVRAIRRLPPRYRTVLVLRHINGNTTRRTARLLHISEDNVKTRLHRACCLLRHWLCDPAFNRPSPRDASNHGA